MSVVQTVYPSIFEGDVLVLFNGHMLRRYVVSNHIEIAIARDLYVVEWEQNKNIYLN